MKKALTIGAYIICAALVAWAFWSFMEVNLRMDTNYSGYNLFVLLGKTGR